MDAVRPRRNLLARIVFAIPIVGWMMQGLIEGDETAMGGFAVIMICMTAITLLTFGLPGLVVFKLGAACIALSMIVVITRG